MIDTVTILFSTLICLYIVLRAIKLDQTLPWYPIPRLDLEEPEPAPEPAMEQQSWVPDWEKPKS